MSDWKSMSRAGDLIQIGSTNLAWQECWQKELTSRCEIE